MNKREQQPEVEGGRGLIAGGEPLTAALPSTFRYPADGLAFSNLQLGFAGRVRSGAPALFGGPHPH